MDTENPPAPPLVSIIVPMFNSAATIERAIASCLDQTMGDFEIIVVDDASTDASRTIVAGAADPRVRLIPLPGNVGPGDARNRALDESRGKWLTVLDADDSYVPTRLQRLLEVAGQVDDPLCVLVDRWSVVAASQGRALDVARNSASAPALRDYDPVTAVRSRVGGKPFFSRDLLNRSNARYPSGVRFGEDTAFLIQLLNVPKAHLAQIGDVLYRYTYRNESLTRAPDRLDHLAAAYRFMLDGCDLRPEIRLEVIRLQDRLESDRKLESAAIMWRQRDFIKLARAVVKNPALPLHAMKLYGRHRRFQTALRAGNQPTEDGR